MVAALSMPSCILPDPTRTPRCAVDECRCLHGDAVTDAAPASDRGERGKDWSDWSAREEPVRTFSMDQMRNRTSARRGTWTCDCATCADGSKRIPLDGVHAAHSRRVPLTARQRHASGNYQQEAVARRANAWPARHLPAIRPDEGGREIRCARALPPACAHRLTRPAPQPSRAGLDPFPSPLRRPKRSALRVRFRPLHRACEDTGLFEGTGSRPVPG